MKEFTSSNPFSFSDSIAFSENSIVSKFVMRNAGGNISLFAFDKGQELSEHTAPFDALVQVLEGSVRICIADEEHLLKSGESIIMPANIPHALFAEEPFKMLLSMLKN